jgi:hypothetical protein
VIGCKTVTVKNVGRSAIEHGESKDYIVSHDVVIASP